MSLLYPRDKDIMRSMVKSAIENLEVPSVNVNGTQFVRYDKPNRRGYGHEAEEQQVVQYLD